MEIIRVWCRTPQNPESEAYDNDVDSLDDWETAVEIVKDQVAGAHPVLAAIKGGRYDD